MNNRLEEFEAERRSPGKKPPGLDLPSQAELVNYASLTKQWAMQHPVPCIAAAFVVGVAVAWIVKRK